MTTAPERLRRTHGQYLGEVGAESGNRVGRLQPVETPSRIEIAGGTHVTLTWEDGAPTVVPAARLRAGCPCADCRSDAGERRKERVLQNADAIRVVGAHVVGAYAVNFEFGPDAHRTGIFSYELLRSLGSNEIQPGGRIG